MVLYVFLTGAVQVDFLCLTIFVIANTFTHLSSQHKVCMLSSVFRICLKQFIHSKPVEPHMLQCPKLHSILTLPFTSTRQNNMYKHLVLIQTGLEQWGVFYKKCFKTSDII